MKQKLQQIKEALDKISSYTVLTDIIDDEGILTMGDVPSEEAVIANEALVTLTDIMEMLDSEEMDKEVEIRSAIKAAFMLGHSKAMHGYDVNNEEHMGHCQLYMDQLAEAAIKAITGK